MASSIGALGLAVEADAGEAHLADLLQRAGEVLHLDPLDPVERAGGGLGEHAGLGGGVAAGGDDRVGGEGDGRAQDRADVVRVGDLVEDDDEPGIGERIERKRGQGRDLDRDALVHRLAAEQTVEERAAWFLPAASGSVAPASVRRASAFGVATMRRISRRGLASAASTGWMP